MKRRRRVLLALLLVFVLASVANATLIWTVVDQDGGNIEIDDIVLITVTSDDDTDPTDWGIYLSNPQSGDYPTKAELNSATIYPTTGSGASEQGAGNDATTTPRAGYEGDDYLADESGDQPPRRIYTGVTWSTVQFQGHQVGSYTVNLYNYGGGEDYTNPGEADLTVTLDVVPEPATVVLLGLGGLLLLRRRRK